MSSPYPFAARTEGPCRHCSERIEVGEMIVRVEGGGYAHAGTTPATACDEARRARVVRETAATALAEAEEDEQAARAYQDDVPADPWAAACYLLYAERERAGRRIPMGKRDFWAKAPDEQTILGGLHEPETIDALLRWSHGIRALYFRQPPTMDYMSEWLRANAEMERAHILLAALSPESLTST